jgi:hypothetical protein
MTPQEEGERNGGSGERSSGISSGFNDYHADSIYIRPKDGIAIGFIANVLLRYVALRGV